MSICLTQVPYKWFQENPIYTTIRESFTRNREVSAENTKYSETFTNSIRKYNPHSYFCGQNQSNVSNDTQNSLKNFIFENQVYNHPSNKGRKILLPVSNTTPINNAIKTITIPTIKCFLSIIILYWIVNYFHVQFKIMSN